MEIVTLMEGHHLAAFQDLIFPVAVVKAFVGVDRCQQTLTNTINECDTVEATQCLWGSGPVTSWFWLIYNCGFWRVSWKDSFQRIGVVMLMCFYWFLHSHRLIRCQALIVWVELTCERIHLRWWWGWAAWLPGTRSRCSSIWKRCYCGDSRTCRSCCLTGAGNESQSGTGPCGQSRARTPGNGLTELQEDTGGTNR